MTARRGFGILGPGLLGFFVLSGVAASAMSDRGSDLPGPAQVGVSLGYRYVFLLWIAAFVYSLRMVWTPGKGFLSAGLLLMAVAYFTRFAMIAVEPLRDLDYTLLPWVHFLAVGCLVVGVARSGSAAGWAHAGRGSSWMNRYYETHELISRAASVPTANEDLEAIKARWFLALKPLVSEAPEQTSLRGNDRYNRVLSLERYVEMPPFEEGNCGQLRSVHIRFAGPGDPEPWMTAIVKCEIDERSVGTFAVRNSDVLRLRERPDELRQVRRIGAFLRTGRLSKLDDLGELIESLVRGFASVAIAPPILFAAVVFSPVKAFLSSGHRRVRFVPTRAPEVLPAEETGMPVGYWNTLLPDLAPERDQVAAEVRGRLDERARQGIKVYEKDVIQWGGYRLKEVRRQLVVELRRAKVYVGIYGYGRDLYVRWDSHINRRTWLLKRFPYAAGLGYRFRRQFLSWAVPLFTEVPDVYEFAPTDSKFTDYDWADVDAIQDLAHEILTDTVRGLKERHNLQKEIDFEMKQGWRGGEQRQDGEEDGASKRRSRWSRLVRQQ